MAKYNKKIAKRITDLIKQDSYTIAEICSIVKLSERCFYNWKKGNAEFADAIARARLQFDEILVEEAKTSLRKLVNGYDVEEKKTVYVNHSIADENGKTKQVPKIKEQVIIVKHFQPDFEAIKFVLTNKAAEEYKNKVNSELTGKDGKDLFVSLTDEELDAKLAELIKKMQH